MFNQNTKIIWRNIWKNGDNEGLDGEWLRLAGWFIKKVNCRSLVNW